MVQEVGEGDLQVGAAGGQSGEEELPPPPAAGMDFCCKYCDKKFDNKHALGGHQNAHRMERAMDPEVIAKRIRRGGFMDYGFLQAHLAGFSPFPGSQVNLNHYFLPGQSIPSPEIPTSPPNANPFPPAVPENHSPHSQVSPAAMIVSGGNTPPGVPADSPLTPRPPAGSIVINSNPRNTPAEINKDGELDLTLKL